MFIANYYCNDILTLNIILVIKILYLFLILGKNLLIIYKILIYFSFNRIKKIVSNLP